MIQSLFGFLSSHLQSPFAWLTSIAGIVFMAASSVNRAMGLVLVLSWDRPARKKFNLATSVGSPGQRSCLSCGLHIGTLSCCRRPHAARRNLVKNSEGLAALRGGCGCAYHSVTGPHSYFVSTCRCLFFLSFFHFGSGHPEGRVRSHYQQNPDPEDRKLG